MLDKPLKDVTIADLQALVDANVGESQRLEYKEQLPKGGSDGLREFCKDVTAMANAQGGDIVFGVREPKGAAGAAQIVGLGAVDADAEQQRLNNVLGNGVDPPLRYVDMKVLAHAAGPVLLVRVPRSLSAPHMVTTDKTNRFYVRTGNVTALMAVDDLRAAFLGGQAFEQRVDAFRRQRIMKLLAGDGPVPEIPKRLLVVHFIPLALATGVDLTDDRITLKLVPLGRQGGGWSPGFNLDGRIAVNAIPGNYSLLFRNGIVEGVSGNVFHQKHSGPFVQGVAVASHILDAVEANLVLAEVVGVRPPFAVTVALTGVRGHSLHPGGQHMHFEKATTNEDMLICPEVIISEVLDAAGVAAALRPLLDVIWQSFGLQRCVYYDFAGVFQPRQLR